jgi:chaperonin GroES
LKGIDLVPLRDKVIVERYDPQHETVTESGIVLMGDGRTDDLAYSRAVAVGDGLISLSGDVRPPTTKVGDVVIYNKFDGQKLTYEGREYTILNEDQIYALERYEEETDNEQP